MSDKPASGYSSEESRSLSYEDLEKRLKSREGELSDLRQEFDSLVRSVSHDLRAPLHHINGFVYLLKDSLDGQLGPDETEYMGTIVKASEHLSDLIEALLVFSRIARAEMYHIEIELGLLLGELVEVVEAHNAGREIQWAIDEFPSVLGDPSMLRQLLGHLLDNAMKYNEGEVPRIEIRNLPCDEPGRVLIGVKDNGIGFDMRSAEKIFYVFQRLQEKPEVRGLGVGLSNAQRLVKRHGGELWVESEKGVGSTFFFTLPRFVGDGESV